MTTLQFDGPRIIDTDMHVTEPPDVFTDRISTKRWGGPGAHVRWDPQRRMDCWYVGYRFIVAALASAAFGWGDGVFPNMPPTYADDPPSRVPADALARGGKIINFGSRVVTPPPGRADVLRRVQRGHSGLHPEPGMGTGPLPHQRQLRVAGRGHSIVAALGGHHPEGVERLSKRDGAQAPAAIRKMDVGRAVVFLASEDSDWVTGQTLGANGGRTFV